MGFALKLTFVGGGSFMTLPIVRAALEAKLLCDGEICLFDPARDRAEAMARMIEKTPEFAGSGCEISWDVTLDEALSGADAVRVGFPCGSEEQWRVSMAICRSQGFIGSDQLSPSGALLALKGGPIVLDIARRMEKLCPNAWLLIFANPVNVYSAMVNNYTSIHALGICGGYANHMWDLSRLMGRDEERNEYDVEVAGVNHLSFIQRGTYHGRDLYEVLKEHLTPDWRPPVINGSESLKKNVANSLDKLVRMLHQFGIIVFSTEGDGLAHLFYDEILGHAAQHPEKPDLEQILASVSEQREDRRRQNEEFAALAASELDSQFWATAHERSHTFRITRNDILVHFLKALSGCGPIKIVASRPNRGAVAGFSGRMALEYSMVFDGSEITPSAPDLAVPDPFYGLIASLSMHQTLLADAIATEDPKKLFEALYAYPIKQGTRDSRGVFRELLEINKTEVPEAFLETAGYFRD
jgi:alpha-galactosidase/6-phospho-beta-glucosidase family protein